MSNAIVTNAALADSSDDKEARPAVLLLGPALHAVSGVSSHLRTLLDSTLAGSFDLRHFQIGSEGRDESTAGRLRRLLSDPIRLLRAIRRRRVDAVHVNTSLNGAAFWRDLLFVLVARLCRTPVLYQVHGGALPQDFFRGNYLLTALLRVCLGLPDSIVVLAHDELVAYRQFLAGARISVIPNAIDCRPYRSRKRRSRSNEHRLHIVYLGRLANGKGLDELLRALTAPALARRPPLLTVAGSGPQEQRLRDLAGSLQINGNVEFVGPLFGDAKRRLLESADVFVLPSYSEGLPYALLEAMAAGAAVIVTPVGAMPDVVTGGVHGLLVAPQDIGSLSSAIAKLDGHRQLLDDMSRACRKRVLANYDLRRLERDFVNAYRIVTSNNDADMFHRPVKSQHG